MSDLIPANAVVIVDRAEGNAETGTAWQDSYIVPVNLTLLDLLLQLFGKSGKIKMPSGRVTITLPTEIK